MKLRNEKHIYKDTAEIDGQRLFLYIINQSSTELYTYLIVEFMTSLREGLSHVNICLRGCGLQMQTTTVRPQRQRLKFLRTKCPISKS